MTRKKSIIINTMNNAVSVPEIVKQADSITQSTEVKLDATKTEEKKDLIIQEPLIYRLNALQEKVKRIKMEQHYQKLCYDNEIARKAKERDDLIHNLGHELINSEKAFEDLRSEISNKHHIKWEEWAYNPEVGTLNKISKT